MITGSCHCGAVEFTYQGEPEKLVICNCSICRRLAPLWAHGPEGIITIKAAADALRRYSWGDRGLDFCACAVCNCTTHWQSRSQNSPRPMAVNCNLSPASQIAHLQRRHFDGADTWRFLD